MGKPILVTGSHRSGTTWTGKIIAESNEINYISEPFNLNKRTGLTGLNFNYWFTYINNNTQNQKYYEEKLTKTLKCKYHLFDELQSIQNMKDILRMCKDYSFTTLKRIKNKNTRPLMKDPLALLSTEWLYEKFDMDIVILIRHPASFISSIKNLNWEFPFEHFLNQPILMQDKLHKFEEEIQQFSEEDQKIIDQGILLWRILYSIVYEYKKNYPEWNFYRHEDLSANPVIEFEKIFNSLGLEFTSEVKTKIQSSCNSNNLKEIDSGKAGIIKRDSKNIIKIFKDRLSKEDTTLQEN